MVRGGVWGCSWGESMVLSFVDVVDFVCSWRWMICVFLIRLVVDMVVSW